MYQALYRKWRPSAFDEVCGQEHITSVLKYEISSGAQSHAYLFSGSRGTGKTTCAKILAKAVNCLNIKDGDPCGECEACRMIDSGEATDVLEMDAASNTGVDYIRDIRDDVVYAPTALKNRVYIIDEVHMLSGGAFNALLKTLEEPPSHVVFILATTEPHKIPSTILSRCQHFEFRRIASSVIVDRLKHISAEENIKFEDEALHIIAKLSLGGMRDAISLLELCAAGGEGCITPEVVNRVAGVASRTALRDIAQAVLDGDYDTIFTQIEELHASSKDIGVFWQELLEFYRDILIIKTAPKASGMLDLTAGELEDIKALAPKYTKEQLVYHCSMIEKSYGDMQRYNSNKRIIAELTLVKMCDPALEDTTSALLARISVLEDKLVLGNALMAANAFTAPPPASETQQTDADKAAVPQAAPTSEITATPKKAEPEAAAPLNDPDTDDGRKVLKQLGYWIEAVNKFTSDDPLTGSYLHESKAYVDEDGRAYVKLKNGFGHVILDRAENRRKLASVMITASGGSRVFNPDTIVFRKPDADNEKYNFLDELADE